MKAPFLLATVSLIAVVAPTAADAALYTLNETASFSHVTGSNNFGAAASGSNWAAGSTSLTHGTFSWGVLATDGSANTATFSGSSFSSADWGGTGTYTSTTIDVSGLTEVDIKFAGSSVFNSTPTEFFNFFYQIDGGSLVSFGSLTASPGGSVSGTQNVPLSSNSSLVVGFSYNHNGSSDNAIVSQLEVVPEPTAALLGSLGLLGLLRRRRP